MLLCRDWLPRAHVHGRPRQAAARGSEEALPFVTEALEKSRRILGDDHHNTLNAISSLATLLKNQGRYDQALIHCTEALEGQIILPVQRDIVRQRNGSSAW